MCSCGAARGSGVISGRPGLTEGSPWPAGPRGGSVCRGERGKQLARLCRSRTGARLHSHVGLHAAPAGVGWLERRSHAGREECGIGV